VLFLKYTYMGRAKGKPTRRLATGVRIPALSNTQNRPSICTPVRHKDDRPLSFSIRSNSITIAIQTHHRRFH
jgi:hypothetical protein